MATPTDLEPTSTGYVDVPIPISSDWPRATRQIWDLRDSDTISEMQWEAVLDWLCDTVFDDKSFLAAEVAFGLVQNRAPQSVRDRIQVVSGPPPKCRLSFQRIQ